MKRLETGKTPADYISYKDSGMYERFGKNSEWQQTERIVRDTLQSIGKRIEASDSLRQRIDFQVENRLKEERRMKHMNMKKVVIGVAAACLVLGTIAVAGSGVVSITGHSSSIPDYTKYEDMAKAEAEIGYTVDAVESFGNGFHFKDIHIAEETLQDESGQVLGEEKSIKIKYSRGKEEVTVSVRKILPGENAEILMGSDFDKTIRADGVTAGYSCDTYKAVPPDYELTEEDRKNMESGHFQLAYGTDEVEISKSYYTGWIKDGMVYSIHGFDLSMGADEMLGMAQEIIESVSRE